MLHLRSTLRLPLRRHGLHALDRPHPRLHGLQRALFAPAATLALLAACGGGGSDPGSPAAPASPPQITAFTASPASIVAGATSTLAWTVIGATSLSIAPGVGAVSGAAVDVSPAATTTYTLTAQGAGGTVSATVEVTVTPAPVTVTRALALPRAGGGTWPQLLDVYAPPNPRATIVFLHGGGGTRTGVAEALGLESGGVVDEAWLRSAGVSFIVPQGQALAGTVAYTWSNRVMDSGQDDRAFLQELAAAIRAGTVAPATVRVYLAGHSNGGMMANRMWCESSATFDAYGAVAGPPSQSLRPAGTAPCTPATPAPYWGLVGDADQVLQTAGNNTAPLWTIDPALTASPAFVDPVLANEMLFHATRVSLRCAATAAPATVAGTVTLLSDCGGSIQARRIAGADHSIASLEAASGSSVRQSLVDFFTTHAAP